MYEKKTTVKDNQTEIRFKKNEENDLKHTKKKQNWKRLRHFLCVSLRCHGNEIQAAKYFKLFSVFSWILFYVSTFFLLFHFLAPSLPALPTFSLCCHDQTAVHCICSRVPRKKKKKKLFLTSCCSQLCLKPNHLARVWFDIIFVNFELNIARRLCATGHALGLRKKETKQVTFRSGEGGGRKKRQEIETNE